MNEDEIGGGAQQMTGKAQEGLGRLAGDTRQQVRGIARQAAGHAQETYGEMRDVAQNAAQQLSRYAQEKPLVTLMVVGAIAYLLGRMTMRR